MDIEHVDCYVLSETATPTTTSLYIMMHIIKLADRSLSEEVLINLQ
jgi:hypothetical protein